MRMAGDTRAPTDIVALTKEFGTLPPHVSLVLPTVDISTYSFFAITDYCITVRGTVGIECPCFGIPTFTAGTGRYSHLGFTHDFNSQEAYKEALCTIQEYPPLSAEKTEKACRHAHALFHSRLLPFDSFVVQSRTHGLGRSMIDKDVYPTTQSFNTIRNAKDVQSIATWIFESTEEDYVHIPKH